MTPQRSMETGKIYCGDVLEILKGFESEKIDCIVTSPPYFGLRDYGIRGQIGLEKTLDEYLEKMLMITEELKRVLKKTGTMWWNHGDSYASLGKIGGDFGQDGKISKGFSGRGRISRGSYPEKSLLLQNFRLVQRAIDEQKWILRNIIIWWKPNCMPSSVKDRFTVDYEPVFFLTKSKKYWFEPQYESHIWADKDKRSQKNWRKNCPQNIKAKVQNKNYSINRVSYCIKGRNKRSVWKIPTHPYPEAHFATFPITLIETPIKAGCPEFICKKCGKSREKIFDIDYDWQTKGKTKGMKQSSGKMATIPGHATKKVSEIGYTDCGCNADYESGIVLDPFMGSGTTAYVARQLRRRFVGIEISKEYCKLAEKRLAQQNLII